MNVNHGIAVVMQIPLYDSSATLILLHSYWKWDRARGLVSKSANWSSVCTCATRNCLIEQSLIQNEDQWLCVSSWNAWRDWDWVVWHRRYHIAVVECHEAWYQVHWEEIEFRPCQRQQLWGLDTLLRWMNKQRLFAYGCTNWLGCYQEIKCRQL